MDNGAEPPAETLRAELKIWEKAFSDEHQGRKATRNEIKQYPEIAQKYRLYNKLRSHVSDTAPPTSFSPPPPKRRKPSPPAQKPQPQASIHPSALDPYDSPRKSLDIHLTPTNHNRHWVGPTPQKNGVAIGLFDFLSPESVSKNTGTPSKKPAGISLSAQRIAATPSKRLVTETEGVGCDGPSFSPKSLPVSKHHPSRTPQSMSKRLYLSQFLAANTPSRSQRSNPQTPSSRLLRGAGAVSKLIFGETPEYLRRDSQHAFSLVSKQDGKSRLGSAEGEFGEEITEEKSTQSLEWSPIAVRLPRKAMGRTLSSLVQSLRDTQEQELDDDLDVLREIENAPSINAKPKRPRLLVRDSQIQERVPLESEDLGFESLGEEAAKDESKGDQGGKRKVWKKKGQKRTTRRVVMRPVVSRWQPEQEWQAPADEENEMVEESQIADKAVAHGDETGSEFGGDGSNGEDDTIGIEPGKKATGGKVAAKPGAKSKEMDPNNGEKKGRKTSRAQPQNFRALKMRNKGGANGIGRAKSKFGKGGFRRR